MLQNPWQGENPPWTVWAEMEHAPYVRESVWQAMNWMSRFWMIMAGVTLVVQLVRLVYILVTS